MELIDEEARNLIDLEDVAESEHVNSIACAENAIEDDLQQPAGQESSTFQTCWYFKLHTTLCK